jgi:DNA-binding CsgD family transcriptional regulator
LLADLHVRHDLPWWAAVGFVVNGHTWALSLLRNSRQNPFDRREQKRLAQLAPHFRRVIGFSEKIALAGAQTSLKTLEHLGAPAMFLDQRGAVKLLNPAAEALLGPDLRLYQGRLEAAHPQSERNLRSLIGSVVQKGVSRATHVAGPVLVYRSEKRPLLIQAMPVSGLVADVFQTMSALLLFTDLDARPVPPERALREAFALTQAEARLASRLGGGEGIDDAINALGIGKETARTQLKAIFAKTGVSRQAELVALLAPLRRKPGS